MNINNKQLKSSAVAADKKCASFLNNNPVGNANAYKFKILDVSRTMDDTGRLVHHKLQFGEDQIQNRRVKTQIERL